MRDVELILYYRIQAWELLKNIRGNINAIS